MEVSIIRDYQKVKMPPIPQSISCIPMFAATKGIDFRSFETFGINPIWIYGLIGVLATVYIGSCMVSNEFNFKKFLEKDFKLLVVTIVALIFIIFLLVADFHIYI